MTRKTMMIDDDNQSMKSLPCGFVLNGNKSKRTFVSKIHKKKCSMCKFLTIDEMVYIPADGNVDYLSYERGETRVDWYYSVPAPTADES